jgi:hypothetical protein
MSFSAVMVKLPLASSYVHAVSRGRRWFNISAIGTRPSVFVPEMRSPKIRVMTTLRAQTNSSREYSSKCGTCLRRLSYSSFNSACLREEGGD